MIFSFKESIYVNFEEYKIKKLEIEKIFIEFVNLEDINNNLNIVFFKRLLKNILGYNKIVYGIGIFEDIKLVKILEKC